MDHPTKLSTRCSLHDARPPGPLPPWSAAGPGSDAPATVGCESFPSMLQWGSPTRVLGQQRRDRRGELASGGLHVSGAAVRLLSTPGNMGSAVGDGGGDEVRCAGRKPNDTTPS